MLFTGRLGEFRAPERGDQLGDALVEGAYQLRLVGAGLVRRRDITGPHATRQRAQRFASPVGRLLSCVRQGNRGFDDRRGERVDEVKAVAHAAARHRTVAHEDIVRVVERFRQVLPRGDRRFAVEHAQRGLEDRRDRAAGRGRAVKRPGGGDHREQQEFTHEEPPDLRAQR